jgi:hypothetical protein
VTFIAKSFGTMALGAIGGELRVPLRVNAIWLTPMFDLDYVEAGAIAAGWRSLVISGAADPTYDEVATRTVVAQLRGTAVLLPRADHKLEVEGDVVATARGAEAAAKAVLAFLDAPAPAGSA